MDLDGIIAFFEANRASPKDLAGLARYGIKTDSSYGVRIPVLRALAKRVRPNHALALELWATGIHDACTLAPMIDDPAEVSRAQMNRWARDFDSWDICDNCCNNLFRKTKFAHAVAVAWAGDDGEFVRRAGFALLAVLAVHDKDAPNRQFLDWLRLIERHADDERNYVKKAVNWALRQIGKRNRALHKAAVKCAERLVKRDSKSARWIARDALRELHDDKTQSRIKA